MNFAYPPELVPKITLKYRLYIPAGIWLKISYAVVELLLAVFITPSKVISFLIVFSKYVFIFEALEVIKVPVIVIVKLSGVYIDVLASGVLLTIFGVMLASV